MPYYKEPFYRDGKLGQFISAVVAASSSGDLPTVIEVLRSAIEAESRIDTRVQLLEQLADAAALRGSITARLDAAVKRWRAEAPPDLDRSTPGQFDNVTSLEVLETQFVAGDGHVAYDGVSAYLRLVPNADLDQARRMFERWPPLQNDSRARFMLADLAISSGQTVLARDLLDAYTASNDERAAWSYWEGAGKLRYFQARLKLIGAVAHDQAYDDLVGGLSAGREYAASLLVDFDDIFPTVSPAVEWPAMWENLADQLQVTREYALGEEFEEPTDPGDDDDLIAGLFRWAGSLSLSELERHVRVAASLLLTVGDGPKVFAAIARSFLHGDGDEPLVGMQILSADAANTAADLLKNEVIAMADHPDYAVAVLGVRLCRRWGLEVGMARTDLPAFYRIHLNGDFDDFERPTLVDPQSGVMRVEDPLGWTFVFEDLIKSLARRGVSVGHIRHRCRMLIDAWGGLAVFGKTATDSLQVKLSRLDMRLKFFKPHITVGARAVRHIAGEMRRAGLLGPREEPWLLNRMIYPALDLPAQPPTKRPDFIARPSVDPISWTGGKESWLSAIGGDLIPLRRGRDLVIAEITRFERHDVRRELVLERLRAPFLAEPTGDELQSWLKDLPRCAWIDGILPLSDDPAPTIVRRLSQSQLPETPPTMLALCPIWLNRLFWRLHPDMWLTYLDRFGHVVARVTWWRDGGPVDIQEDVMWGEGVIVTVTQEGRAQLEALTGPLNIHVHARREYCADQGAPREQRRVSAVV